MLFTTFERECSTMRVVVDTNEMLRMAAAWQAPLAPMVSKWRDGRFEITLSNDLLAEFESVATRPQVRRFLPAVNAREFGVCTPMGHLCQASRHIPALPRSQR